MHRLYGPYWESTEENLTNYTLHIPEFLLKDNNKQILFEIKFPRCNYTVNHK
jgi:hypothetical protein